jgi:hypothetical protein
VAGLTLASVVLNTSFREPPRYDGAGYAVLGWSLATGHGYREVSHPDAPPHAHFPPGYPCFLAGLFRVWGRSEATAHAASAVATTLAAVAAWAWFRRLYSGGVALLLGLALAANWTWGRIGGAIQSEPLYLLLGLSAIAASSRAPKRSVAWGLLVGGLLGASVLTRHVGVCLAAAVVLDLALRGRVRSAIAAVAGAGVCLIPWAYWLSQASRGSQARLFRLDDLPGTLAGQALFYARRIPDQVLGPFIEIATIYQNQAWLAPAATAAGIALSAVVVAGWGRSLATPRRRLAGLLGLLTLALLLAWPFTEAGRFLIPLVPAILVGAVEGLIRPLRALGARRPRSLAAVLLLAASLPYPLYSLLTGRAQAARDTHRSFDEACAWIARQSDNPGPVLSQYPADVFWQTRRLALEPATDGAGSIERTIRQHGVAYLLVDEKPFTNAPVDPLARHVALHPSEVRLAWGRPGAVSVYEVVPSARRPRASAGNPRPMLGVAGPRPTVSAEGRPRQVVPVEGVPSAPRAAESVLTRIVRTLILWPTR